VIAKSYSYRLTFEEDNILLQFGYDHLLETNIKEEVDLLKKYDKKKWDIIDHAYISQTKYMEKKRLLEELQEQRKAPEEKKIEEPQEDDLFKDSLEESERDIEKKEYQRRREELLLLGKAEVKKRLNAMGKRFPTIKMGENKGADEPMKRAASIILDKRNRNLTEEQILLLLG